jgi:hypothetical protein
MLDDRQVLADDHLALFLDQAIPAEGGQRRAVPRALLDRDEGVVQLGVREEQAIRIEPESDRGQQIPVGTLLVVELDLTEGGLAGARQDVVVALRM